MRPITNLEAYRHYREYFQPAGALKRSQRDEESAYEDHVLSQTPGPPAAQSMRNPNCLSTFVLHPTNGSVWLG